MVGVTVGDLVVQDLGDETLSDLVHDKVLGEEFGNRGLGDVLAREEGLDDSHSVGGSAGFLDELLDEVRLCGW